MPINRIATLCIFVTDQDRAKAFYTQALGFELRADEPLFPGAPARWLAVAPQGAETDIILYLIDQNWEHYKGIVGKSQALTIDVSDMPAVHAQLKARGVKFVSEPQKQPWGTFATIEDSEGNQLLLVERPPNL
jgi:lactoylglutathione lyase